jgi:hypothetical protein
MPSALWPTLSVAAAGFLVGAAWPAIAARPQASTADKEAIDRSEGYSQRMRLNNTQKPNVNASINPSAHG